MIEDFLNKNEFEQMVDDFLLLSKEDLQKEVSRNCTKMLVGLSVGLRNNDSLLWKACEIVAEANDLTEPLETISFFVQSLKLMVSLKNIVIFENMPLSERQDNDDIPDSGL